MPRLAASVAAFMVIAFGIGFNMVRYPIVWDLVGATSDLSQPSESSRSEAAAEPSAPAPPDAMPEPQESWRTARAGYPPQDDPIGGTAYRSAWGEEDDKTVDVAAHDIAAHEADLPQQDTSGQEPAYQASPPRIDSSMPPKTEQCESDGCRLPTSMGLGSHTAYPPAADLQEAPAESGSRGRLVPVTRPDSPAGPSEPAGPEPRIRMLPPLGQTDRTAADLGVPQSHGGPVPFYPSTGSEEAADRPGTQAVGRLP